jgi:hypothetical protein
MSITAKSILKLGLAAEAYGIELRLWREAGERQWAATLRDEDGTVHCRFEEDDLKMAKLHLVAEARRRAQSRDGAADLPGCEAFLDFWRPVNLAKS